MKAMAASACRELAGWIFDGATFAWAIADRIERRFNLVGCTEAELARLQTERFQFVKEQSKRHDDMFPDRISYLHR